MPFDETSTDMPENLVPFNQTFVCLFDFFVFCLFDLILYVPSTIFQLNRDGSSWIEPVLS